MEGKTCSSFVLSSLCLLLSSVNCWGDSEEVVTFMRNEAGLQDVPASIPSDAKHVFLIGNNITNINADPLFNLSICTKLHIGYNYVSKIEPGAFLGLHKLEYLWLVKNNLTEITPDMLEGLISLIELDVGWNELTHIKSGILKGLPSLKILLLNNNKITTIEAETFAGHQLHSLQLQGNLLDTFDQDLFSPDDHPEKLQLSIAGNPLHCDTGRCWLKEAQRSGWILFHYTGLPECDNYPGVHWHQIDLGCITQQAAKSSASSSVRATNKLLTIVILSITLTFGMLR